MSVKLHVDREGESVRVMPSGDVDIANATTLIAALQPVHDLDVRSLEVNLGGITRIDGTGAVLIAGLIDRFEDRGRETRVTPGTNPDAARLIALYRGRKTALHPIARRPPALAILGEWFTQVPRSLERSFDFIGTFAASLPQAVADPRSVNWGSLPRLIEQVGADSLAVACAANLLVGVIIALLGVSQLARFGAVRYVPELVVVAQFRELAPLITAIVIAGRCGAGLSSEMAAMKVSEEVDALRSMGFDPMRWLVLPRCLALVIVLPVLTLIGDLLADAGAMFATVAVSDMSLATFAMATVEVVDGTHLVLGLIKTPFLALAIGMIACSDGLAAKLGAVGVGASTTRAVVRSIFAVIVIDAIFTLVYASAGL